MELNREAMMRAFVRLFSKNQYQEMDPVTLSETVIDKFEDLVDMADAGSGGRPVQIVDDRRQQARSIADFKAKAREQQQWKESLPPPEQRSIVMPGDPEFIKAESMDEAQRRQALSQPAAARITRLGPPQETAGVKYWGYQDLIQEIERNTPDRFMFCPNGMPPETKVLAVRNIEARMGLDCVMLTYRNPKVSDDRIEPTVNDEGGNLSFGAVNIAPIASCLFLLTTQSHDFEKAMDKIEADLKGLYAPRPESMEPNSGPDPGPLSFNLKRATPMGDQSEIHLEAGWRNAANPRQSVMDSVIRSNEQTGNRR